MNDEILITLMERYEELYNLKHQHYHNQLRRDNIWEEIGQIMNESGETFRDRWTKIRDNHRKALQLRKTKSGQAASKMKPPKYYKELSFLAPYLQDEENRVTNIPSYDPDVNSPSPSLLSPNSLQCESFDYQDCSSQSSTRRARSRNSDETSTASVLKEYLERRERAQNTPVTLCCPISYSDEKDPLMGFFINMARTVKGFPIDEQIKIKNEIFSIINNAELKLAMQLTARETEQTTENTENTKLLSHPQVIKTNANIEKTTTHYQPQLIQSIVSATSSTHQTIQAVENCTAMLSQPSVTKNDIMNSSTPLHTIQVLQDETFPENTYTLTLTESDLANYVVFNS